MSNAAVQDTARARFTARMELYANSTGIDWSLGVKYVDPLLKLLGIVRGYERPWLVCHGINEKKIEWVVIRDVGFEDTKSIFKIIPCDRPNILRFYLERSLPRFLSLTAHQRKTFHKLFDAMRISCSHLFFPLPFVILGLGIEDFVLNLLPERASSLITKSERKALRAPFKNWLEKYINPLLSAEEAKTFLDNSNQKLSHVVGRTLRERIYNLLSSVSMKYDSSWVSEYVKRRNAAAHGNYSYKNPDYLRFSRMVSLIHRFILRQFNYRGKYIDWSVFPGKEKDFPGELFRD